MAYRPTRKPKIRGAKIRGTIYDPDHAKKLHKKEKIRAASLIPLSTESLPIAVVSSSFKWYEWHTEESLKRESLKRERR